MRRLPRSLALTFCFLAIPALLAANTPSAQPAAALKPGKKTLAHIQIKGMYPEAAQPDGLFGNVTESLAKGIARLDKAAGDKKISGVILEIKSPAIGWAKLAEMRQAVSRVRAKGKKVYAVLESGTTMDYLLATSCDEIIMPESGMLVMLGLRAEVSFYKNLFDKLSIKAEVMRVGEYKSAGEPYTRTEMSPEFRKEMEELLDDFYTQMVGTIAQGRALDTEKVKSIIDSGPHSAQAALELGLIDHVAYDDQVIEIIKAGNSALEIKVTKKYGKKKLDTDFSGFAGMMKMMSIMMGADQKKSRSSKPKIAIIQAEGAIVSGSSTSGMFGGSSLGSDTLVKAIRKANADDKVKAIVLRVNSPGGSALASDMMWRAFEQVEKPFVVSMGDVAASGGYYISMGADTIFAESGTITGSIGVVGGKVALKGLYEKLGINTTVISRGKNSGIMSSLDGFNENEKVAMQKMLDDTYLQFTQKAAQGRKMPYDKLEKLARGRVYTGTTALKHGLVDKLGTLEDAVAHAIKLAGLKPEDQVERMVLPKARSPFEALFGPIDEDVRLGSAGTSSLIEALGNLSPELATQLKSVQLINLLAREGRLTLMPFNLKVK